jgi:hypothetical protein
LRALLVRHKKAGRGCGRAFAGKVLWYLAQGLGDAWTFVKLPLAGVDSIPQYATKEVAGGAAAAFNLILFELNVEAGEEGRDSFIGKATLAEGSDLAIEQVDDLSTGKALLLSSRCLAKLASDDCDLFRSVSAALCHLVPLVNSGNENPSKDAPAPWSSVNGVP